MKRKLIAVITSALCLAAALPTASVYADGQKVVTLGADLTEEQKQAILRYFGVAGQNLQTLTITNQDERDHLGSYVPLEQIGTRTYSCALVNPTNAGGIQVKTANLSWVTSNMIASTLSTSGVVNCEVLAAAPFEVSGTGALTGIIMAYESAVGETLDSSKKEVATQELITTTQIANNIGQAEATEIVNESKIQVIQGNAVSENDIEVIINEVAEEENISLSDEDRELLIELMNQIAEQDYEYEEMKETLERVESNMEQLISQTEESVLDDALVIDGGSSETEVVLGGEEASDENAPDAGEGEIPGTEPETEALAQDSILMNTDDSALGESVIFDATDDSALAETEAPVQTENTDGSEFEIVSSDTYTEEVTDDGLSDVPVIDSVNETTDGAGESAEEILDGAYEENAAESAVDGSVAEGVENTVDAALDAVAESEIPADGSEVMDGAAETEAMTEAVPVTLNLELIPLSEFVLAPMTSESTAYELFQAGTNELTISFQRADIIGGSGTLTLYNAADSSIVETITMADPTKVAIEPLTAEELLDLGWTEGYQAVITLSAPLAQNASYFVALSEDALSSQDGIGHSEATPDNYTWVFNTNEYGFYLSKNAEGITAGNTVAGQVIMDGTNATYACIENADPAMVTFDIGEFSASGSFNATFMMAGETSFQISFYDVNGMLLNTIPYTVTVK